MLLAALRSWVLRNPGAFWPWDFLLPNVHRNEASGMRESGVWEGGKWQEAGGHVSKVTHHPDTLHTSLVTQAFTKRCFKPK